MSLGGISTVTYLYLWQGVHLILNLRSSAKLDEDRVDTSTSLPLSTLRIAEESNGTTMTTTMESYNSRWAFGCGHNQKMSYDLFVVGFLEPCVWYILFV